MKPRSSPLATQPRPRIPGLTRRMVRTHAAQLFRDVFPQHPLTERDWRLAEEDLARKLETEAL